MKAEDLYNRRRFFKKTLGIVVPILSMIIIGTPVALADTIPTNDCNNSCAHACSRTCNVNCRTMCAYDCNAACAKSLCKGGCKVSCYQSCRWSCGTACDGKCIGTTRSEIPVSPDSIPCVSDTIKNNKIII